MPLPSSTIGQNNFNPILAAQGMTNESSQFLVKNLSNLGASIADSISINNMRREAQEVAPRLAQSYQQGLGAIQQGDIAGGLQQIYQTNAEYSTNPFLAPIGKQAAVGAGMMANGQIRGMQQAQQIGAMNKRTEYVQGQQNERTKYIQQQIAQRQGAQGGKGKLTANQKILAVENFNKQATDNIAMLDSTNPEEFLNAYEQYSNTRNALNSAGLDVKNPHYEKKAHDKLESLNKQLDEYAAMAKEGKTEAGWFGTGGKLADLTKQIQEQKDRIIKASTNAIKDGYSIEPENEEGALPEDEAAAQEEDAIPAEITSKDEFDALPAGATYVRGGKIYKKP